MTFKGSTAGAVAAMAGFCFFAPARAHVVDLGTFDVARHHSSQFESQAAGDDDASTETDRRSAASSLAVLPWDESATYTFADVIPAIDAPLSMGRKTVITFYHEVMNIESVATTEKWLGLAVGICLIVMQLRRTQRLLHHRPLAR